MNITEAIAEIGKGISVHPSSRYGEAVNVLLAEYKQLQQVLEGFGPKLLEEMRNASDWQAVSVRLTSLLKNRDKPGVSAVIDETLKKLAEPQTVAPQPGATEEPAANIIQFQPPQ